MVTFPALITATIVKGGCSQVPKCLGCQAEEFSLHRGDSRGHGNFLKHAQGELTQERGLECGCWGARGAELVPGEKWWG